jgi:hypothetical protein
MCAQEAPLKLSHALQALLEKVQANNDDARRSGDVLVMLNAILENQERIAEGVLILGNVIHGIAEDVVEVEVRPPKGYLSN